MNDNLLQIKKQVLAELGYLSYMEKKKIKDDHDQTFIEEELKKIKKRKKLHSISAVFITLAFVCVIMSLFYDSKPIISTRNLIGTICIVLVFLSNILLYVSQLMENKKREILYKILSVFNKQNINEI